MSANPPNQVPGGPTSQEQTALSAVFRRIAGEPEGAAPPPPPRPRPEPSPEILGFTETVETAAAAPEPPADPVETADPVDIEVEEDDDAPPPAPRPLAHLARPAEAPADAEPAVAAAPDASRVESVAPPLGRIARPDEVWPLPRSVGVAGLPPPLSPSLPPEELPPRPFGAPAARARREPAVTALAPSPAPALERGERPGLRNRRLHRRAKLAADIDIDGVRCALIDLSIGGFAAAGAPPVAPNSVVPVALHLRIDGIDVGTRLGARIIYATEARAGGRFVDPTASQTAFLRYVVTWRGESVGPVGATTLLDAITGGLDRVGEDTAIPAALDAPPPGDGARERWWVGLIGRKVRPPR